MGAEEKKVREVTSIDEYFSCDCGTHDHSLSVELDFGGNMAILEMSNQRWFNRPWYECFWGGLQAFWEVFWTHQQSIEIVLNRQEHGKFKKFFAQLVDQRCWNCDPEIAVLTHKIHG